MKKILLVEDDPNKVKQIVEYLNSEKHQLPSFDLEIKKSFQSGLNAILYNKFDLILLDMSMHTFDRTINEPGGEHMQFAGEDILKEMYWNDIPTKAIIVTQYDIIGEKSLSELKDYWQREFTDIYVGTVFYGVDESNWKPELLKFLKNEL